MEKHSIFPVQVWGPCTGIWGSSCRVGDQRKEIQEPELGKGLCEGTTSMYGPRSGRCGTRKCLPGISVLILPTYWQILFRDFVRQTFVLSHCWERSRLPLPLRAHTHFHAGKGFPPQDQKEALGCILCPLFSPSLPSSQRRRNWSD